MFKCDPFHSKINNCVEDIYATVLRECGLDYSIMYVDSWSFGFFNDNKQEIIGSNIYLDRNYHWKPMNQELVLKEYLGIEIKWIETFSEEEFMSIIKEQLDSDKPVGVCLDSYMCPWNPAFQKAHITHYALLIDYDDENFIFCDPFFEIKKEYINKKVLLNNNSFSLIIFNMENISELKKIDIQDIFINCANKTFMNKHGLSDFEQMRLLANRISKLETLDLEFKENPNIGFSPIARRLESIAYGRMKFLEFIKLNSSNEGLIKEVNDILFKSAKDWMMIRANILKSYFVKNEEKHIANISQSIIKISNMEEDFAKYISGTNFK